MRLVCEHINFYNILKTHFVNIVNLLVVDYKVIHIISMHH